MQKIKFLIKYFLSFIIDLSIVFALSLLIKTCLVHFFVVDYFTFVLIILLVNIFYCFSLYSIWGTTLGKSIYNIKLTTNNRRISLIRLFCREFLIKLPILILIVLIPKFSTFLIFPSLLVFLSLILVLALTGNSLWGIVTKTSYVFCKSRVKSYIVFVFVVVVLYTIIRIENNLFQKSDIIFCGLELPEKFPKYPHNNIDNYVDFLAKQRSAADYIFRLFEKNDIVILCEPNHREVTNWNFISSIVSDKRFISDVGNVFTEYGSADNQKQLDQFLATNFKSKIELEKTTSSLLNFMNRGFYQYLLNLNVLNSKLPDTLKIIHYFSDISGMHDYVKQSINENELISRDSLMANVVIEKFNNCIVNEKRKKCLVITNYRHAFIDNTRIKDSNQAEFIKSAFPEKTANVLINSYGRTYFNINYPIQDGKWDIAFAKNGNTSVGFDFDDSPFGNDYFDLLSFNKSNKKFQDMFNGFVFTNSLDKWLINTEIPYHHESAINECVLKQLELNQIDSLSNAKFLKSDSLLRMIICAYNWIPLLLYLIITIFSVTLVATKGLKDIFKQRLI